jgi:hypothetical protein
MKPEEQLKIRYADLLTDPSDDALDKLVQELDAAYTAPERPIGLSWATASLRLALIPQQTLNAETRSRVRPLRLRTKDGRVKVLFAFAAIVVVALLSAALLATIGVSWMQQSHQAQKSPFLASADMLVQQLLQSNGTPANIRQLAQSGQFTALNYTKTTDTGNVTVQGVYADANNVVLVYSVDQSTWMMAEACSLPAIKSKQCRSVPVLTVTTSDEQTLTENAERVNMGPEPVPQNQRFAVLAYYDASSIQGNPKQLYLTVSLAKKVSPSQEKIGEFTVPFHADKTVIDVHQTATSHGDALTLERVVITPTEIRFYNKSTSLDLGLGLFPTQLSIAGKRYDSNPFPADLEHPNMYGWFAPRSSHFVSFYDSLQRQTGTWTVTEQARVWTGTSFQNSHLDTWTFTFTVS